MNSYKTNIIEPQTINNLSTQFRIAQFIGRMKKMGIEIELSSNYPWIYLEYIDKRPVREKFLSEHRFTIGFHSRKNEPFIFSDITKLFEIIRKYTIPVRKVLIEKAV
jgi:hypothetical protein